MQATRMMVKPGFVLILILFTLMATVWAAAASFGQAAVPEISHANLRHGSEADTARQCLDGRGGHLFFNSGTNRYGIVCQVDDSIWGIVITNEAGREITAFLKNKAHRFDQVLKYMQNRGYQLVH